MRIFVAQQLHDIAPPVDYSLIPTWVIFLAVFLTLCTLGLLFWLVSRRKRPGPPLPTAHETALQALQLARLEIESLTPYVFSIRVSDILRSYVADQYGIPLTRQTSMEFLSALAGRAQFSEEERLLLSDFLSRSDLIKFARYSATSEDSHALLAEAEQFVQGGQLASA